MNTAKLAKDLQHVRSARFAIDRTLESRDCFFGLTNQQQTLAHVIAGHRVVFSRQFSFGERIDGFGVFATMGFEHSQQHPGRPVFGIFFDTITQSVEEFVKRSKFNVVPIDTFQSRASSRALFQNGKEAIGDLDAFRFFFRQFFRLRVFNRRLLFLNSQHRNTGRNGNRCEAAGQKPGKDEKQKATGSRTHGSPVPKAKKFWQ